MNTIKETVAFAIMIAGFLAVWFVVPAGAQEYEYHGDDAYFGPLGDAHYNQPNNGPYALPYYHNPEPVHQPGPVICNNVSGMGTMCQQY